MNELVWEIVADRVRKLAEKGFRVDRRKPMEYRNIVIEPNIYYYGDGSALVSLGRTKVAAGVKFELGTPFPDKPDEGTIVVDAELLPVASPTFEPGPPDENAVELARVVDRCIRESGAIDFKSLCVREGELVWIVHVDLRVLDDGGNLFDAASLAALSALLTARIPKIEDDKVIHDEYEGKLKLEKLPLLTTFAKIGPLIVVDPSLEEEKAMDARVSVGTTEEHVVALQKGGSGAFSIGELDYIFDRAIEKGNELRKVVRKYVQD